MQLKGMTWDHPRGYEPLLACSKVWESQTGIQIKWDKRSLQDFEAYPVQQLAQQYDLIVIDHPHVGQITAEHCLHPLDETEHDAVQAAQLRSLIAGSVGPSVASYRWNGRQWALPIDAAAQVQAWVSGVRHQPIMTWDEVLNLADEGVLLCPMRPPHSLMLLFTLAAHLGCVADLHGPVLFNTADLTPVIGRLLALSTRLPDICWQLDPIDALEEMAAPHSQFTCAPYIYGYVNYAWQEFRARRLVFSDIPVLYGDTPKGSALGGTGIAVSAYSRHIPDAVKFAYWVASGDIQRTIYAQAGGQPGHADAWNDIEVNTKAGNFYRDTYRTLTHAWVRPRHDGYMSFQNEASLWLNHQLLQQSSADCIAKGINDLYAKYWREGSSS